MQLKDLCATVTQQWDCRTKQATAARHAQVSRKDRWRQEEWEDSGRSRFDARGRWWRDDIVVAEGDTRHDHAEGVVKVKWSEVNKHLSRKSAPMPTYEVVQARQASSPQPNDNALVYNQWFFFTRAVLDHFEQLIAQDDRVVGVHMQKKVGLARDPKSCDVIGACATVALSPSHDRPSSTYVHLFDWSILAARNLHARMGAFDFIAVPGFVRTLSCPVVSHRWFGKRHHLALVMASATWYASLLPRSRLELRAREGRCTVSR
jgi:hypothetical protein